MKALVTGGTGFVGGHLIERLLAAGDQVTALVRSPAKATGFAARGVRAVAGDLTDSAALSEAARNQDVIYHVAGVVAARDEAEFLAANRDGTARLLAAAAGVTRARLVLVSSLAAAGPSPRGARRAGDEPPSPVTAYGRSKLAGEQAVRSGPLPWTILRPPAVYGPGDREFLRAFKAARLGLLPVFGDGRQELSLVFAPDLAEALLAAARSPDTLGKLLYPCHPEVATSSEVARAIGRAVGKTVRAIPLPRWIGGPALGIAAGLARLTGRTTLLSADKAHEFYAPAWTADPGPLTAATGWRAGHDLRSGLQATAAWYRAAGWL